MDMLSTPPLRDKVSKSPLEDHRGDVDIEMCYFSSQSRNSPDVKSRVDSPIPPAPVSDHMAEHDYIKLNDVPKPSPADRKKMQSLMSKKENMEHKDKPKSEKLPFRIETKEPGDSKKVHKIIIVPAGVDIERATAQAMDSITEELNQRAADRLAKGHTPEKETVVEITRICTPSEAYFSSEGIRNTKVKDAKSPIDDKNANKRTVKRSNPLGDLKNRTTPQKSEYSPNVRSLIKKSPVVRKLEVGANKETGENPKTSLQFASNQKASQKVLPQTASKFKLVDMSCHMPHVNLKYENKPSTQSNCVISRSKLPGEKQYHKDVRVIATDEEIDRIAAECGRKKRPPFSYMHLIQMAISSKEDRKMTLKEIYKWVEEKFPYYRYATKQGWKNSIRHNLSLYDIFVREKPNIPGTTGSSYWTLKHDTDIQIMCRPANSRSSSAESSTPSPVPSPVPMMPIVSSQANSSPLIMLQNGTTFTSLANNTSHVQLNKTRKGPALLLPKPAPAQAFALIPIQSGVPIIPTQSIVMPAQEEGGKSASANLKRNRGYSEVGPMRKHVKIASKVPEVNILDKNSAFVPPAKGSVSVSSSLESTGSILSLDSTSELGDQLSQMKFDSGIDWKSYSDLSSSVSTSQEMNASSSGLPKPNLFPGRTKRPRKEKQKVRHDLSDTSEGSSSGEKRRSPSNPTETTPKKRRARRAISRTKERNKSDEEKLDDMISNLENDLSPCVPQILKTPEKAKLKKSLFTSTPTGEEPESPSWISPIRGLTPLSDCDRLDSGIFTPKMLASPRSELTVSPHMKDLGTSPALRGIYVSPKLLGSYEKSPRPGSLRSFGLPGLTPMKSGVHETERFPREMDDCSPNLKSETLLKIMGDFHFDPLMGDGELPQLSFGALH